MLDRTIHRLIFVSGSVERGFYALGLLLVSLFALLAATPLGRDIKLPRFDFICSQQHFCMMVTSERLKKSADYDNFMAY